MAPGSSAARPWCRLSFQFRCCFPRMCLSLFQHRWPRASASSSFPYSSRMSAAAGPRMPYCCCNTESGMPVCIESACNCSCGPYCCCCNAPGIFEIPVADWPRPVRSEPAGIARSRVSSIVEIIRCLKLPPERLVISIIQDRRFRLSNTAAKRWRLSAGKIASWPGKLSVYVVCRIIACNVQIRLQHRVFARIIVLPGSIGVLLLLISLIGRVNHRRGIGRPTSGEHAADCAVRGPVNGLPATPCAYKALMASVCAGSAAG